MKVFAAVVSFQRLELGDVFIGSGSVVGGVVADAGGPVVQAVVGNRRTKIVSSKYDRDRDGYVVRVEPPDVIGESGESLILPATEALANQLVTYFDQFQGDAAWKISAALRRLCAALNHSTGNVLLKHDNDEALYAAWTRLMDREPWIVTMTVIKGTIDAAPAT